MSNELTKTNARAIAKRLGLPAGPLSHTQINTYLMCPRSYYFQYVKKVPRIGWSENLLLGSALHAGLEHVNRQKQNGARMIRVEPASQCIHSSFLASLTNQQVTPMERKQLEEQVKKLTDLLELWVYKRLAGYNPTGVELALYVTVAGIPMVIKIDMLDNDDRVIDFKLTRKFKGAKDAQNSLQLSAYCLGTGVRRAGFISFRFPQLDLKKKWKPELDEVFVIKKKSDLIWTEEVIGSVSNSIIDGNFPLCDPSSWKCSPQYCDWFPICRGKVIGDTAKPKPKWMSKILRRPGDL